MKRPNAVLAFMFTALLLAAAAQPLYAQAKNKSHISQTQAAEMDKLARQAAKKAAKQAAQKRKELARKNHYCIHCGQLIESPDQKCPAQGGKTACTVNCPDCGKNLRDKANLDKKGEHRCRFKAVVKPAKPVPPQKAKPAPAAKVNLKKQIR